MKILLIATLCLICGCSTLSPYRSSSLVDRAIKECGIGYSTEAAAAFKSAYEFAGRKGSADFSSNMKEGLNSQIMAFAINDNIAKRADANQLVSLIKGTQECVIERVDSLRPKTQSELISDCRDDLQRRVNGRTEGWPKVKNYFAREDHPEFSKSNLVMSAFIDHGGRNSRYIWVNCKIEGNRYVDLAVLNNEK